jgi:ABC-2 type transport system ATP-binding protein
MRSAASKPSSARLERDGFRMQTKAAAPDAALPAPLSGDVASLQPPPLRVSGLGRRYRRGRPWAIRDVTLDIPRGSITALVGPNGAGKSTLIRACVGFERPDEGRVLVNGVDPARNRTRAVNSIGYVPQAPSLYRPLSIRDHLDFVRLGRPQFDRSYALARIRAVGLTEDRPIRELSGGEHAQVSLALALGTRADLLLLDEPLASLDPLARRDFLAMVVDDVHGRGATAVLSSHIVTDIEQACDRVVVLAGGSLVLNAGVEEARESHRSIEGLPPPAADVVAAFPGPLGQPLVLVRDTTAGRPASLEEIVLGYLAAARTHRGARC